MKYHLSIFDRKTNEFKFEEFNSLELFMLFMFEFFNHQELKTLSFIVEILGENDVAKTRGMR